MIHLLLAFRVPVQDFDEKIWNGVAYSQPVHTEQSCGGFCKITTWNPSTMNPTSYEVVGNSSESKQDVSHQLRASKELYRKGSRRRQRFDLIVENLQSGILRRKRIYRRYRLH